jgi:cytidylate kinase
MAWTLDITFDGDSITARRQRRGRQDPRPEVTIAASQVSVHPQVRQAMVKRQRELIAAGNYVAEGRDIGTVSARRALKVFLTRARRSVPDVARGETGESVAEVREAIEDRDRRDRGREHGAPARAEDSVAVDTTNLSPDQVVERIVRAGSQRGIA